MILSARVRAFAFTLGLMPAVASAFILPTQTNRTLCGDNKMEDMIKLDANMQAMGHPIGRVQTDEGYCTGTLVDKDTVLTAHHCLADCKSMTITFGYLSRSKETFNCKEIVETGNDQENQDYLLFRVEGNPGVNWGWYDMTDKPVAKNTSLLMIHHPSAEPMKVTRKDCHLVEETSDGMLHHRCDTEPGSSGAAIMIPDYDQPNNTRIVGVHTLGGCSADSNDYNAGPSIHHLSTISHTIRQMVK